MADKWVEAYAAWPPMNQLLFSMLMAVFALLVLLMLGVWTTVMAQRVAILVRGWPEPEDVSREKMQRQRTMDMQTIDDLVNKRIEEHLTHLFRFDTDLDQVLHTRIPDRPRTPEIDWKGEMRQMREDQAKQEAEQKASEGKTSQPSNGAQKAAQPYTSNEGQTSG